MPSKKTNVLVLNSDSFRWDNLTVHGGAAVHTPNLDALARCSVVFENAYAGSYPTLPHRTDAFLGTWAFPNVGWGPLDRTVPTLAEVISAAGADTFLELDCPHMVKQGHYYERGFSAWRWERGHENDNLAPKSLVQKMPVPGDPRKYRQPVWPVQQHQANMLFRGRQRDEDYLMAVVARNAVGDLRHLKGNQFFMWVDMFDPHEPFDPPRHYFDRYYSGFDGVLYTVPVYGRCDCYSKEELQAIRAAYLAESTMVDHWLGYVVSAVKDLGLDETTVIVFTSDHGLCYGDHGFTGKNFAPLYGNVARIPLLVSTPETRAADKSRKVKQLVQPVDLMPTILDTMGIKPPKEWKGEGVSLAPFLDGKTIKTRDAAFSGQYAASSPNPNTPAGHLRVSTEESALIFPPDLGGTREQPMLFNLKEDPSETNDVLAKNPGVAQKLYAKYAEFFRTYSRAGDDVPIPAPAELV